VVLLSVFLGMEVYGVFTFLQERRTLGRVVNNASENASYALAGDFRDNMVRDMVMGASDMPWVVLIVEDNLLVRESIACELRNAGCEVLEASSGETAIMILRSGRQTMSSLQTSNSRAR
jgi:hypothetical protein